MRKTLKVIKICSPFPLSTVLCACIYIYHIYIYTIYIYIPCMYIYIYTINIPVISHSYPINIPLNPQCLNLQIRHKPIRVRRWSPRHFAAWRAGRQLITGGRLPSGKHTKNYGKSPFFMGKSTISTGPFSIANCKRLPEGKSPESHQPILTTEPPAEQCT